MYTLDQCIVLRDAGLPQPEYASGQMWYYNEGGYIFAGYGGFVTPSGLAKHSSIPKSALVYCPQPLELVDHFGMTLRKHGNSGELWEVGSEFGFGSIGDTLEYTIFFVAMSILTNGNYHNR